MITHIISTHGIFESLRVMTFINGLFLKIIPKVNCFEANLIVEKYQFVRFSPIYFQNTKASFCIIRANEEEPLQEGRKKLLL